MGTGAGQTASVGRMRAAELPQCIRMAMRIDECTGARGLSKSRSAAAPGLVCGWAGLTCLMRRAQATCSASPCACGSVGSDKLLFYVHVPTCVGVQCMQIHACVRACFSFVAVAKLLCNGWHRAGWTAEGYSTLAAWLGRASSWRR